MGLLSYFFRKQVSTKSPLEKFEEIKLSVRQETAFLRIDNFKGVSREEVVNKSLYMAADEIIREKLNNEQNARLDKINEIQYVLEALEKEVYKGRMTKAELAEILGLKDFNDYAKVE